MNVFNPKKLFNSKWTAVNPVNKEKHFVVTAVKIDEEGNVIHCVIEAVISKRAEQIEWKNLKDSQQWQQGWK